MVWKSHFSLGPALNNTPSLQKHWKCNFICIKEDSRSDWTRTSTLVFKKHTYLLQSFFTILLYASTLLHRVIFKIVIFFVTSNYSNYDFKSAKHLELQQIKLAFTVFVVLWLVIVRKFKKKTTTASHIPKGTLPYMHTDV